MPKYTQVLSLDASNQLVYIQTPVGPCCQAIDAFLCLHDKPLPSGLEHCLFNCLSSFLYRSAGDLEESKTSQYSSAIGD